MAVLHERDQKDVNRKESRRKESNGQSNHGRQGGADFTFISALEIPDVEEGKENNKLEKTHKNMQFKISQNQRFMKVA